MGKVVIKTVEKPDHRDPEDMLRWFCTVFGFSTNSNCDSIEEELLEKFAMAALKNEGLSSSEITFDRPVARSTVIYHLNHFIDSGFVVKRGRKYYLRATELSKTIEEIEYDMEREFNRMMDMAKEFDRIMAQRTALEITKGEIGGRRKRQSEQRKQ